MKYEGKLYGSIDGKTFFETGKTSKDWDRLEEAVKAAWIAMDSIDDPKAEEWQDEFADLVFPSVNTMSKENQETETKGRQITREEAETRLEELLKHEQMV